MSGPVSRARQGAIAALAVTAAAGLSLSGLPQGNATSVPSQASVPQQGSTDSKVASGATSQRERKGYYDARAGGTKSMYAAASKTLAANGKAIDALKASLGPQGIVDIDPVTGTPRNVGKLDGYLTGASSRPAGQVARGYVRAHLAALGLTRADLSTLRLRQDYVDVLGTHHISWEQVRAGVPVFGNGLKANVSKRGQLISVQGSPVSGLTTATVSATPRLSASSARTAAVRDVGGTLASSTVSKQSGAEAAWSNGDSARLVWFAAQGGLRLGWATLTTSGDSRAYSHVIDADTGRVLYRRDLVQFDRGDAKVFDNYPGARRGGTQHVVNFIKRGYIGAGQTWLHGRYASAWADVNDDNRVTQNERTPLPGTKKQAQFTLTRFHHNAGCSPSYICTWDSAKAFSWRVNKKQDVTNAFYLASNFHNYLARKPIGFTARAGNFERRGRDPLLLNALDGANTANGLPDGNHIDNANMATYPDGTPPTMQMYLWHQPGAGKADPFIPVSGSDDASIVYHEYIHGLSNRLVVDATGQSTLNSIQAGSMGEAWSDYYALDYLVTHGFIKDSGAKDGQVLEGKYVARNAPLIRNEAIDCDPRSTGRLCTDIFGGHGYTYGDFSTLPFGPEVHASGEIWGQTLWDMREKMGHRTAAMLITRAMELAPADPSFLDMRNAILQADTVAYGSRNHKQIWQVFAHRGMGWYAGSIDAGDTRPAQDFHRPPPVERPRSLLAGIVYDPTTGSPVVNALVSITGHDSGYIGDYTARTDNQGIYRINDVYPGTYKKVVASANGYELGVEKVTVARNASHFTRHDFAIRRDWAARSGGGAIVDFNGPDYSSFGCGPSGAIDLSQGTGWGSTTGDDAGNPTNSPIPKFVVIRLPRAIDIAAGKDPNAGTAFVVDPSNTCGDPGSSSTNRYRIDVSVDGTTWVNAAKGSFGTIDDPNTRGHYFNVRSTKTVAGVQYVRFTMVSPQVPDIATNCPNGPYGGCVFMDMTEIEVFGTPTGP